MRPKKYLKLFSFFFLLISLFICSCKSKDEEKQEYIDEKPGTSLNEKEDKKIEIKEQDIKTPGIDSDTLKSRQSQTENSTKSQNKSFERTYNPVAIVTPLETEKYMGKDITVKGFVADVYKSDKVAYLNFVEKYPKNPFTAVIFASRFASFKDINKYETATVEVTGRVSTFKGKPQIILDSESQIKIVR